MFLNEDKIRRAISASVYETLGEKLITSIEVEFHDEIDAVDDVITVRVIVNADADRAAFSKLGLTLRKKLSEMEDTRFPLVSLISKNEYKRSHR